MRRGMKMTTATVRGVERGRASSDARVERDTRARCATGGCARGARARARGDAGPMMMMMMRMGAGRRPSCRRADGGGASTTRPRTTTIVSSSPRVVARTVALTTVALGAATLVGDAAAAAASSFVVGGGDGFVGAPDFASDEYMYRTPDFAVDLASPLVAYRLVTTALGQKVPAWLDAIIAFAALGAAYVVFTDDHSLDSLFV